jgi:ubiquinone/menaquinone biosynthesis C-methylase UbiE
MNADRSRFEASETYWCRQASRFARLYRTRNPVLLGARLFLDGRQKVVGQWTPTAPAGTAVDVGCGSGEFAERLSASFGTVIGVDYSEQMLELARAWVTDPKVAFVRADCARLPLGGGHVDFLSALGLLDYVKDPAAALTEFSRVMKPGATGVLTIPKSPSLFAPLRWSQRFRSAVFGLPPIVNVLTKQQIQDLVTRAGLGIRGLSSLWTTMWIVHVRKI